MDERNPYAPPETPIGPETQKRAEPRGFWESVLFGSKTGFKYANFIAIPCVIVAAILEAGVVILDLIVSGEVPWQVVLLGVIKQIGNLLGFYVVTCLWGIAIGVGAGMVGYGIRRVWKRSGDGRSGRDSPAPDTR